MSLSLVVLAAGIGSRYGGLKQMEPVGPSGEFIIDYSVFDAIHAGFDKIVFVIRKDIEEAFRETIGNRVGRHVAVEYVNQELLDIPPGFEVPAERKKPWGTGHATLTARGAVHEPFGVINADDFYGRESYRVLAKYLGDTAEDEAKYSMVAFLLNNTLSDHGHVARGICEAGPDGYLQVVVERTKIEKTPDGARFLDDDGGWKPLTGRELVSMNMWGFKPSFFAHLDAEFKTFLSECHDNPKAEFFIPTVVNTMMQRGVVTTAVLETPCRWAGVTYPQEKDAVVAEIARRVAAGEYPSSLWG